MNWSALSVASSTCLFISPCSKPKANVVYQPPSLYGGDEEDVSMSLAVKIRTVLFFSLFNRLGPVGQMFLSVMF